MIYAVITLLTIGMLGFAGVEVRHSKMRRNKNAEFYRRISGN